MDCVAELERLAEQCPDYPSLSYHGLPQGPIQLSSVGPTVDRAMLRRAVLAKPALLVGMLGYVLEDFHAAMLDWCLKHPQSGIESARGFGKSIICTCVLSIIRICRNFNDSTLITSERDSQVVDFLREIRQHLEENWWLKQLFGEFVGKGKWTDHKLEIKQCTAIMKEGNVDALQMGGGVTGKHWKHIIVDDPTSEDSARSEIMRDKSFDYYFSTLKPCLIPGGTLQFRATRYHYSDLVGRIEREIAIDPRIVLGKKKDGTLIHKSHVYHLEDIQSQHINVPRGARMKILKSSAIRRDGKSLWPSRWPIQDRINANGDVTQGLVGLRAEMGVRRFGEQFQMVCDEAIEGERQTECREEWLPVWESPPSLSLRDFRACVSVDPAWTSKEKAAAKHVKDRKPDYSCVAQCAMFRRVKMTEAQFYALNATQGLWSTGELIQNIMESADELALIMGTKFVIVRIERTGLQIKAAPEFYRNIRKVCKPHRVIFRNPQINKVAHARPLFTAAERGEVRISPELEAMGFVTQCGDFPYGEHDDMIDAVAGGYRVLWKPGANLGNYADRNKPVAGGRQTRSSEYAAAGRGTAPGGYGRARR